MAYELACKQSLCRKTRLTALAVLLAPLAGAAWACPPMPPQTDVVSSGRDCAVIGQYEQDAEHIAEVAARLGYRLPPMHRLTFVPAGELGEMSGIGHYPLPHWHDGAQVVNSRTQVSGVLEFVTKGSPVCRSFYSDTTSYWEQLSVIFHVMGHNDFGLSSAYSLNANNDTMAASLELGDKVNELLQTYDHDEVSEYVQWLYSLEYLQDFAFGSYDPPSQFKPENLTTAELVSRKRHAASNATPAAPTRQKAATQSVFAAFIHNLPADAPVWKKELAEKFEEMTRHYHGNVNTKTMNEGWATFSQFFLVKHSKWADRTDSFVDLGGLMSGVAYPQLSNPYWLGLECWKNLYRRFTARPDIASLSALEQDRLFVDEAHNLMNWQSDYDFVRYALDEQWVADQRYFLYRAATNAEWSDYATKHPDAAEKLKGTPQIVLTRQAQRIINYIARQSVDNQLHFPQIYLESFNAQGSGALALRHEPAEGIPLVLPSAAQTQLVLALVMERPVHLKTILRDPKSGAIIPVELQVTPAGKLTAQAGPQYSEPLTAALQPALDAYLADLDFSASDRQRQDRHERFGQDILARLSSSLLSRLSDSSLATSHGKFLSHSPNSGTAVLEYKTMLAERFARMLRLAVTGQLPTQKGQNGVRFRVMPVIPHFELDLGVRQALIAKLPPAPLDDPSSLPRQAYQFGQDDAVSLQQHRALLPGDIFAFPPKGKGQGQSEGEEGEEAEGEPSDEGEDAQAGQGGQDPSSVEVPIKDWGQALQELIGLPNLRRTNHGETTMDRKKKRGTKRREYGEVVYRKMLPRALAYPLAADLLAGKELSLDDIPGHLLRGFSQIRPADYVVKDRKEVPLPSSKAVIVVVMDFSGSMQGEPHKMAANFVYNLRALLMHQYDEVKFRYVVYDEKAHEFSEEDVFGRKPKFLGGGTSNVVGYQKAEEILTEYDYEEWNKYVVGLGDAGAADGPATVEILDRIYPSTQHISFVYTDNGSWGDESFLSAIKGLAERRPWVGFTHLEDASQASIIRAMQELYPPVEGH